MKMKYTTALIELPLLRETAATTKCQTPGDVLAICGDMCGMVQESMQVIALNARNKVIGRHMITLGLVNISLIHPREAFRAAILDSACALIIVHNHPGGDPMPSAEDVAITRRMIDAGKIVGITVLDHVVIARNDEGVNVAYSMRELGICTFDFAV